MTKFTKERLEEIAELARKAKYKPCAMHMTNLLVVCDSEVIEEMARQLLASMEQEPVGEVVLGDYDDCGDYPDAKVVCIAAQGQADWNNFSNGTKLYAAPQLPQLAAVDEMLAAMEEVLRISDRDHDAWHGAREGIAACRAAMLHGADGRSPVIQDGWVACSERMPEQFVEVLACTEDGGRYIAALNQRMTWDDGDFFDDIQDVTHWQPLPSPPAK